MRVVITASSIKVWINKQETYKWAHLEGHNWPCSGFAGKSIYAELDNNGLLDFTVNSRHSSKIAESIDGYGFSCCVADHLKDVLTEEHSAYWVNVGQFINH